MRRARGEASKIYDEYVELAQQKGLKIKKYHSFYSIYFIRNKSMEYILQDIQPKTPADKREYFRLKTAEYRKRKRLKVLQEARLNEGIEIKTIKKSLKFRKELVFG